ncbi:hypothetical protein AB4Y88_18450 [Paenarthrobacter sp. RAF9]
MLAKLSVTVAVDMDAAAVTLRPTGRLTPKNVQGLLAVVRRATRVLPGFDVLLDLDQLLVDCPETLPALSQAGAGPFAAITHAPGAAPVPQRGRPRDGTKQLRLPRADIPPFREMAVRAR